MADQDTLRGQVSEYRIYESIASGGFGSVYIGRDTSTNVPVGVKRLHPHLKDEPGFVDRFEQEAATVRGLDHPNIVRLLDQGRDANGVPFIVMEWVEGLTIGDWLKRRGRYSSADVANVACQALEGLEAAWTRRVVHRDIKPANLMVTPTGRVKIMDFGVAKDVELATLAGSSGLIGTPAYMAPEQLRGQPLDCRADLYALGITLFVMLAGRPPFEGPSFADYFRQHLEQEPPDLRQLVPGVDPGVAAVLRKALAKNPDERFANPTEMLAALRPYTVEGTPPIPPTLPPDATIYSPHTPATHPPTPGPRSVVPHDMSLPTVLTHSREQDAGATVAVSKTTTAQPGPHIAPWMIAVPVAVVLVGVVGLMVLLSQQQSANTSSSSGPASDIVAGATATVQTQATAVAGGTLFQDSLTDIVSGKLQKSALAGQQSVYSVGYGADGYSVQNLSKDPQNVTVPLPGTFQDTVMDVDVQLVNPSDNQFATLTCRDQGDAKSAYQLRLFPTMSSAVLVLQGNGIERALVAPTKSAAVNPNGSNHVELSCVGSALTATVNGTEVLSTADGTLQQGGLLFGAGAVQSGALPVNVWAKFKNLSVSRP